MTEVYNQNALACSKLTTRNFSTSFSVSVRLLHPKFRMAIYAVYGFVRFADEIVDSFFQQDQEYLLDKFRNDAYEAIERGFSTNPILHSFQWVVNEYGIDRELIDSFLQSMEMDLHRRGHDRGSFHRYLYGSAEAVGLMCLKILTCEYGTYDDLKHPARKLGEAFQKVNFLRDIREDYLDRGRTYFPDLDMERFDDKIKKELEDEIQKDFDEALNGIKKLRTDSRFGVYVSYYYYTRLFSKIKKTKAENLVRQRYRISNVSKFFLTVFAWLRHLIRHY
ncbi:MAG TPA: phytoene/squalene synthase family protein [Bacteroidales bacterium]|nr:phytoene/squalene synthase family protein [Bacteroidales bacterium]HNS46160.1 phytoene/squalene synthase family protein [Bacteroidales bacterium]